MGDEGQEAAFTEQTTKGERVEQFEVGQYRRKPTVVEVTHVEESAIYWNDELGEDHCTPASVFQGLFEVV